MEELDILRKLTNPEDTGVHNVEPPDESDEPQIVYVGDPTADTPKPRKNNVAVYGRKFQR